MPGHVQMADFELGARMADRRRPSPSLAAPPANQATGPFHSPSPGLRPGPGLGPGFQLVDESPWRGLEAGGVPRAHAFHRPGPRIFAPGWLLADLFGGVCGHVFPLYVVQLLAYGVVLPDPPASMTNADSGHRLICELCLRDPPAST